MAHPNDNSNASIYADNTPVRSHRLIGIIDADKRPLDNFQTITHFVNSMPLNDKTEMLLTLLAYCKAQLNG
jgi:hypothetical protein